MDPIIETAVGARTVNDLDGLEKLLRAAGMAERRFLGDQEANWSSLSSPAESTSIIWERPVNMLDGVIELEAERRGEFGCKSPAAAAQTFFGVPAAGLGEMSSSERDKLAKLSLVQVLDSDDSRRKPTLAFRDNGTGIATRDVPETILSLQKSNKLRKPYTHGIFGKGGSSACVFSDGTVIVTRKQPALLQSGEDDRITVAIVREDSAPDMGLPYFRYLVGTDGLPYSVPSSAYPDFEPGTYVAHVNYLAGKMGQQNWTNEESIYAYAETILFAPTLPYRLQDARSGSANVRPAERTKPSVLSGLGQRLETLKAADGTILARSGWQSVPVPEVGEVRLRWWLFEDLDKRRTRVAKGFVVVFTTNGQIHHAWDGARLQQLVDNRRRVGQRLFVQVDCDGIDIQKRYKVFDSFRAQVRRGPEGRGLEDAVADRLANDADLDEFESTFTRQSLASSAQNISSSFRKRLNRALKIKVPGLAPALGRGRGPKPPPPKKVEDLYVEPTSMTGPQEVTLLIGDRATVYLQINAIDGFVPDRGSIAVEGWSQPTPPGIGDLRKGRLAVTLTAPAGISDTSESIEFVLTWLRSNGGLGRIGWPVKVKIVSTITPPAPNPNKGTDKPTKDGGDYAFIWGRGDEYGWDDGVVGELQMIKGDDLASQPGGAYSELKGADELIPTIVLNHDFGDWAGYKRTIAKRASDATLDLRAERYGLAVGIIVANLSQEEKRLAKKLEAFRAKQNGNDEPPAPMSPEQQRRALAEAARGVVALMPDFDDLMNDLDQPLSAAG